MPLGKQVTQEMSAAIEIETRQQSECKLWTEVRKHRRTASRFQEICHVRGEFVYWKELLRQPPWKEGWIWSLRSWGDMQTALLYLWQCGIIIHPDSPHLGASPDAKVIDSQGTPPFGLAEVKCCGVEDQTQVKHLNIVNGKAYLRIIRFKAN